jgi:hypothetical protein
MIPPPPPPPSTWVSIIVDHAGAFMTGIGNFITAVMAFLSWRSAHRAVNVGAANAGRIEEIHKATNSMKDALVAATRSDALREGKEHEQDMQAKREEQTAALVAVISDPESTNAEKTTAAADASKPV